MPNLIGPDFIGIQANDLDAARAFYTEIVGLSAGPGGPPDAVLFDTKPIPFAVRTPLVDLDAVDHLGHGVAIWFACDDADAMHAHLVEKNVPIVFAPKDGPFGRYFAFRDPFGYTITAHTAREAAWVMTCWMGVASAEHALAGRDGGFAQLGHGKHEAVKSLRKGDWIVYYSPREKMGEGEPVQAFTTIGQVTSEAPYQVEQTMRFHPFRVDVNYLEDARPAPIKPLLDQLKLTRGRGANWGIVMRGAKRKLDAADMRLIAEAMGVKADLAGVEWNARLVRIADFQD